MTLHTPHMRTILMLAALVAILASCSTTRKNKSITHEQSQATVSSRVDSMVKAQVDSFRVKRDNTLTNEIKEDEYEKKTVVEYERYADNEEDSELLQLHEKSNGDKEDYVPIENRLAGVRKGVVKSITIYERGKRTTNTTTQAAKVDSTASHTAATVDLHKAHDSTGRKSVTTKVKEVKRTSYWGWLWLLLFIILIIPAVYCYRRWVRPWVKTLRV